MSGRERTINFIFWQTVNVWNWCQGSLNFFFLWNFVKKKKPGFQDDGESIKEDRFVKITISSSSKLQ
jgi:hypothetical protein